jgi:hypothetical protein
LAKCRAATASMQFCKVNSFIAYVSKVRNGLLSQSYKMNNLAMRMLSLGCHQHAPARTLTSLGAYNNQDRISMTNRGRVCKGLSRQRGETSRRSVGFVPRFVV